MAEHTHSRGGRGICGMGIYKKSGKEELTTIPNMVIMMYIYNHIGYYYIWFKCGFRGVIWYTGSGNLGI